MVLWGFIVIYAAIAASLFCTIGVDAYRYCVAPRTGKTWIRACAVLGFALGAALRPLSFFCAFAVILAGPSEGGSPC